MSKRRMKTVPLWGRTRVFIGDFMVINKDGFAYPCPLDIALRHGYKIYAAIENVDNSLGACGEKKIKLADNDTIFNIEGTP